MQVTAIALVSLLFLSLHRGSRAFLDSNPELGAYQDDGKCFPMKESWYIAYRNFENDPYFGGTSKCAKATEITPYVHNSSIVVLKYGKKQQYTKVSLTSGCGYNAQNTANVVIFGQRHSKFSITAAYIDCNSCKVFRNSYAPGGNGCTLWKPESKINQENRCCDFVFALLCSGSPKNQVYDMCK